MFKAGLDGRDRLFGQTSDIDIVGVYRNNSEQTRADKRISYKTISAYRVRECELPL
jgi:hypothetical protein